MATFFTIGHSNRSLDEVLSLLRDQEIERVVDVRRFPGSRKYPQFGKDAFPVSLTEAGIVYEHVLALGGRRSTRDLGPHNAAWRNKSFRAYADHLATPEFDEALRAIAARGERERQAFLCSEAVPWRCHRQLISDVLVTWGHEVLHIIGAGSPRPHTLSAHAQPQPDGTVIYPDTVR